jgi:hypothetical protein
MHTELITGTPEECMAASLDYETYPEWQSLVKEVMVHTQDGAGRGREVEFVIDLKLATVRYTLLYDYPDPARITWTYVRGDAKDISGSYTFSQTSRAGVTEARYDLTVQLPVTIPALIRNRIEREAMKQTVLDLKRRVESGANDARATRRPA